MNHLSQNLIQFKSSLLEEKSGVTWLKFALILWGVLWIAVGVKSVINPEKKSVYPCFAGSSMNWWNDLNLYDTELRETGFRYSPTFALAFTPFAVLPASLGAILWSALNIVLLVYAIRLLVKEVFPGDWSKLQEATLLILSLIGCTRAIWSSQSNALVFALAVFAIVSLKKERWWATAFLLAVAVHIKLWPAALALLLMARFPRKLAWPFTAACAVLVIPPFLTRPFPIVIQQYQNWYGLLTGPYRTLRQAGIRDAYTIAEHLGTSVDDRVYTILQLGMAGLALLWCLRLAKLTDSIDNYLMGVLTTWVCWQLLVGPGTERLTFLVVAPIASWALIVSFKERFQPLLASIAWLMLIPLGMGAFERMLLPIASWSPIILPAGIIPLMVWQIAYIESRGNQSLAQKNLEPIELTQQNPASAA